MQFVTIYIKLKSKQKSSVHFLGILCGTSRREKKRLQLEMGHREGFKTTNFIF